MFLGEKINPPEEKKLPPAEEKVSGEAGIEALSEGDILIEEKDIEGSKPAPPPLPPLPEKKPGRSAEEKNINGSLLDAFLEREGLRGDKQDPDRQEAMEKLPAIIEKLSKEIESGPDDETIIINLHDFEYVRQEIYNLLKKACPERTLAILKRIRGKGGRGAVYESDLLGKIEEYIKNIKGSEDMALAVKIEKKSAIFSSDADLTALDHPNLMKVLIEEDLGEKALKIIEYLADYREMADPEIQPKKFLSAISRSMEGVKYLNDRGLIHGDIKEKNIMARDNEEGVEAKVIDMEYLFTAKEKEAYMEEGLAYGTPPYLPLEGFQPSEKIKEEIRTSLGSGSGGWFSRLLFEKSLMPKVKERIETIQSARERLESENDPDKLFVVVFNKRMEELYLFLESEIEKREKEGKKFSLKDVEKMEFKIIPDKYDVFSFGVILRNYLYSVDRNVPPGEDIEDSFRQFEALEKIKEDMEKLAEDMTVPESSRRISISEAMARFEELRNKI